MIDASELNPNPEAAVTFVISRHRKKCEINSTKTKTIDLCKRLSNLSDEALNNFNKSHPLMINNNMSLRLDLMIKAEDEVEKEKNYFLKSITTHDKLRIRMHKNKSLYKRKYNEIDEHNIQLHNIVKTDIIVKPGLIRTII